MEWGALFKVFQSWGPSAISSALVIVVIYLIRKIDADSKKDEQRAGELHKYINDALNNFGARLTAIEKDYVRNDFFFRELSGWKSEINRLSDQITNQFVVLIQNIIQMLNQGKK